MTGFWIALAVLLVGIVGGIAYAVLRGIALWRRLKRTGRAFSVESERIAEISAQIETHMDRANASNTRLGDAAARLATSRARLEVQLQAIREARHTMRRLLWFLRRRLGPGPRENPRSRPSRVRACASPPCDLGTNTTRLLVADLEDGDLEEVVRREEITRLGESVDRRRILLPTAIARVRNVLVDYRREAEPLGAERVLDSRHERRAGCRQR